MTSRRVSLGKDNDRGFVAWRDSHPHGYVLNCARKPAPNYLVLHRTSCWTIRNLRPGYRNWTKDYIKVCSTDVDEIHQWARSNISVAASVTTCGICKP